MGMRSWLIALVVAGCGDGARDIETQITINEGVYGLLLANDDEPVANRQLIVYAPGENQIHARATSNADGIYQIELAPGDFALCTDSCTAVSVRNLDLVRYDWTDGPGGGHWTN